MADHTWSTCRVTGTFETADGARLRGRVTARVDQRLSSHAGTTIYPAGAIPSASQELNADETTPYSYDALLPATDDPGIQETGWTITLTVVFCGRRRTETYRLGGRDGAQLPAGGHVDLSTLLPVDSYNIDPGDPSAVIIQGPPGRDGRDGVDGKDYVPSDTDWPTVRVRPGDPVDDLDTLPAGETRVYESETNAPLAYMLDIGSLSGSQKTGNKVAQVTTLRGPASTPARLDVTLAKSDGGTSASYTTIDVPTPGSVEQVAELRDGSTVRRVFFDKAAAVAAEAADPVKYAVGSSYDSDRTVTSRTVTFADAVTDWDNRIRPGSFLAAYDRNSPQMEQNTSAVVGAYGVTDAYGAMLHLGGPHRVGSQYARYKTYNASTGAATRSDYGTTFPTFGLSGRLALSNPQVSTYNTSSAIDPRFMYVGYTSATGSTATTRHIVTINDGRAYSIHVYVDGRCDLVRWQSVQVTASGYASPRQPVSVTGVPASGPGWAQVLCYNHTVQVVWLTQADWAASGAQQDTGWRDVTSWVVDPTGADHNALPAATVTSGKLLARRIGDTCYLASQGAITSGSQLAIQLPANWWSPVLVASATTLDQAARHTLMDTAGYTRTLYHGGSDPLAVPAGSRAVIDSVSWPVTTPFPTVFPGTAVSGV